MTFPWIFLLNAETNKKARLKLLLETSRKFNPLPAVPLNLHLCATLRILTNPMHSRSILGRRLLAPAFGPSARKGWERDIHCRLSAPPALCKLHCLFRLRHSFCLLSCEYITTLKNKCQEKNNIALNAPHILWTTLPIPSEPPSLTQGGPMLRIFC